MKNKIKKMKTKFIKKIIWISKIHFKMTIKLIIKMINQWNNKISKIKIMINNNLIQIMIKKFK